jgi:SAM-dependent methyltransferase
MTALDAPDGAWAGAVVLYAIIHLPVPLRALVYRELARVIRPGGWLLCSFHVSSADHSPGDVRHLDTWWKQSVDLDGHFLDPAEVTNALAAAGFAVQARLDREPIANVEYPSRRTYLIARRG